MQHDADVNAHGMHVTPYPFPSSACVFCRVIPRFLRNDLTALHIATTKNRKDMVLLLLEHGADIGASNKCACLGVATDDDGNAYDVTHAHDTTLADGVALRCMLLPPRTETK